MADQTGGEQTARELLRALDDLARMAWDCVPGCDGASVSVFGDGSAETLAATRERVEALDRSQYRHGDGPCVTAMRRNRAVVVTDYHTDRRWPGVAVEAVDSGICSSLSLPLVDEGGRTLGGLNMYGEAPGAFTDASRRSADALARQATLMLGYLEQVQSERASLAREHEMAAMLQRSLLPSLPSLPGVACAARYLVSHEQAQVGGDWYDLFPLPDGAIGVAIGDVMGHDLGAAAAMGQLRSVLRSYAYEGSRPSLVLDRLDRLVQGFDMAQVATAVFGRLLREDGGVRLVYANAGHLPPVVRRPDGSTQRLDRGGSTLIGLLPPDGTPRSEATVSLPTGSMLLLYTDGLVEDRDRDYDTGIENLCAAVAETDRGAGPEEVCEAITAALVHPHRDDDVALLAVRIDPLPR